jgi:hypothetical protein
MLMARVPAKAVAEQPAPECKDCAHHLRIRGGTCQVYIFRVSCASMRATGHACGPAGALFEAAAAKTTAKS